jgi:hypothetical protein
MGRFMIGGAVLAMLGWLDVSLAHAAAQPVSARQAMVQLVGLLTEQDLEGALKRALSFEEFQTLSWRKFEREPYERRLKGLLSGFARDFAAGVRLETAIAADALILPPDEKLKRELVMVVIHATFKAPEGKTLEGPPLPFLFVSWQGSWKLLVRD